MLQLILQIGMDEAAKWRIFVEPGVFLRDRWQKREALKLQLWETGKGIGLRLWLTVMWPRHDSRISHKAKPQADGKATIRKLPAESQACPEPLYSTQGITGSWPQAAVQWPWSSDGCKPEGTPARTCKLLGRCPILTIPPRGSPTPEWPHSRLWK